MRMTREELVRLLDNYRAVLSTEVAESFEVDCVYRFDNVQGGLFRVQATWPKQGE